MSVFSWPSVVARLAAPRPEPDTEAMPPRPQVRQPEGQPVTTPRQPWFCDGHGDLLEDPCGRGPMTITGSDEKDGGAP